jgi:NAD-dependent dihydropyrimidine dehydrogenase PreA subunit
MNEKYTKWKGLDRSAIDWHPEINEDTCTGYGMCVTTCGRGVFEFDFVKNKAIVAEPLQYLVGCSSCEAWCIFSAISFRDKKYVRDIIRKNSNILVQAKKDLKQKI